MRSDPATRRDINGSETKYSGCHVNFAESTSKKRRNVCAIPTRVNGGAWYKGDHRTPAKVLRDFCSQLSGLVFAIFSALIRESTVPARWKYANVIPAPKANPLQRIETDLRLISLTATLSKLLASFVGVWILNRIEDKLDTRQYRALKGRSTRLPRTLCMVDIMHHWYKAIDEGQSVRSVFIDFAKAFDHVDHNVLVDFALPDSTIRRISSLLCYRRQRVKIWRRDV